MSEVHYSVDPPECCDMKGFLSFLVLWIISEGGLKGSEITKELEKRRGSKPSPGTVYPVLKELKDKKLIKPDENKAYSLTEKGEKELFSALNYFNMIFYDAEEMFKCCGQDISEICEELGKEGKSVIIVSKCRSEDTLVDKVPDRVLESLLETIPLEFLVIDKNDKVLAWNKHETRVFKKPLSDIGKNVREYDPERSLHEVEQILQEMKEGKKDRARFWIDLEVDTDGNPQKILVEYYALRDKDGTYLGCLAVNQNITDLQKQTGE
ncbi:MAG: PAS domain-containing protein [Theionarchaea archaeon]|nr:PAS domain-containing protein [Theionarchaea archaeon]